MSEIIIDIEADINPTEDSEKIKMAIKNFFKLSSIELIKQHRGHLFLARAKGKEGLMKLYTLLRREKILNAARRVLLKGFSGKSIKFCLNKQVATMNRISFCEPVAESPLGPIRIEIKSGSPKTIIDWLTRSGGESY